MLPMHPAFKAPVEVPVKVPVKVPVIEGSSLNNTERKILSLCKVRAVGRKEILAELGYSKLVGSVRLALGRLKELHLLELTIPDKPNAGTSSTGSRTRDGKCWGWSSEDGDVNRPHACLDAVSIASGWVRCSTRWRPVELRGQGVAQQDADNRFIRLALTISPQGRLHVDETAQDDLAAQGLPESTARRVLLAFLDGPARGLLHLATVELQTPLPASLGYVHGLAKDYLTALCHAAGMEDRGMAPVASPPSEELAFRVLQAPPMKGLEYLSADVLRRWRELDEYVRPRPVAGRGAGVSAARNPLWRLVGRVTFHLAENKRDPQYPFAFMASYASGCRRRRGCSIMPLGTGAAGICRGREPQAA